MKRKGFTLIELLIVIAIIGILATIIVINYSGAQQASRYSKAKSDLLSIQSATKLLAADTKENIFHYTLDGRPNNEKFSLSNGSQELPFVSTNDLVEVINGDDGLGVSSAINLSKAAGLLQNDDYPNDYSGWAGSYIDQIPEKDPWGNPYYFDPDYICDVYGSRTESGPTEYEHGCDGSSVGGSVPIIRALISFGEDGFINKYGGTNVVYQAFSM